MKKNALLLFCSTMLGGFYALLITKFGLHTSVPLHISRILTEVIPFVISSIFFTSISNAKQWRAKLVFFLASFALSEILFYTTFFLTFDFDLSDF